MWKVGDSAGFRAKIARNFVENPVRSIPFSGNTFWKVLLIHELR
ncbi:hypothetical protein EDC90_100217 [Martelella mediterranea]|uniref:Uncharacterized protein n=1 Tax=Martelella mediterranea TaxID=293089 RepID=A0A4R3NVQ5_9HYPH|nr:hypothetical protein EDC90_100217 [Martelella mediterranea]